MSAIMQATARLLRDMYDEPTARFSSTTSVRDRARVNEFSGPSSIRYSLNCLLALARAASFEDVGWDARDATDRFLAENRSEIRTLGDQGMLLWLLADLGHPAAEAQYERVRALAETVCGGGRPVLQDVAWLLSGLSAYASLDAHDRTPAVARSLFDTLTTAYVDPRSGMPLHAPSLWRRHLVSFGGITYFLRALWDYGRAAQDEHALSMFSTLTRSMLSRQGEWGEWPWLYHPSSGQVAEKYALYSVHQEGMAMLFLLPALSLGIEGAADAIRGSYRWILGNNELGVPMWRRDPLLVYRSVRRRLPIANTFVRARGGTLEALAVRGTTFVQATGRVALASAAPTSDATSLEINDECRSYEIGWTTFAWAGVRGFEEFSEADMWRCAAPADGGAR